MTAAQARPVVTVRHPDRFFVAGRWTAPRSARTRLVVDCATERPTLSFAEASVHDMHDVVTAARAAADNGPWPRLPVSERAEYLREFASQIIARGPDLSATWSIQSGVLHSVARDFNANSAGVFTRFADMAADFDWEERHAPTMGGADGYLVREPVGVVGAIVPWNGPLALIAEKVAPALLAGCTVVLKASPEAPGEAWIVGEIAEQIGLPPGVLNVVMADRDASEALVTDPRVDKIAFTGSTVAGRRIGALLGGRMGRMTLELGGKSAAVVLDDADLATVAADIAGNACFLTGQVCAALTRVVVPRSRHDDVVDALAAVFAAVSIGDPFAATSMMGPLAGARQRERVEGYIAQGVADGGTLAAGGGRPADIDHGYFIEPTLFAGVDNSSVIAQEEIFGPVLTVIPYDTEDEAVRIANDSPFGLNASVFTADADHAYRIARQLRTGTVGHNATRMDFGIAFGGVKQSGVGREGGREGLLAYTEAKTVILDAPRGPSAS
jgi:aldehyde dehydrogenase (NAD+)